jgi:hypothetical protein
MGGKRPRIVLVFVEEVWGVIIESPIEIDIKQITRCSICDK